MEQFIVESVEVLKKGGVILYPTDTIWGLGCDPTNETAIATIYNIKYRDYSKSMIILADSVEMISRYVERIPPDAISLMEATDQPLTIIYPKAINLSSKVCAADGSIGIRIPKDEFCLKLIKAFGKPIVSTSANTSGKRSPLGFFDIENEIKLAVDYIVPLRMEELSSSRGSQIVKIEKNGNIKVIR